MQGRGYEQVTFLLLHIVLGESPGISEAFKSEGLGQMEGKEEAAREEKGNELAPAGE